MKKRVFVLMLVLISVVIISATLLFFLNRQNLFASPATSQPTSQPTSESKEEMGPPKPWNLQCESDALKKMDECIAECLKKATDCSEGYKEIKEIKKIDESHYYEMEE